jgi:hypothetical protein
LQKGALAWNAHVLRYNAYEAPTAHVEAIFWHLPAYMHYRPRVDSF